jgi:integrase
LPATAPQKSHITRKAGIYRYRRRIPGQGGEICLSLHTRHYREAEYLAVVVSRAFDDAVKRARMAVSATKQDLNAILRGYLKEALNAHLRAEQTPSGAMPMGLWPLRMLEIAEAESRDALAERDFRNLRSVVDGLMERHGLPEEQRHHLGIGVLEAELKVIQEAIRRARGETSLVFPADETEQAAPPPPSPAPPPPPPPPPTTPLASALVEPHFQQRAQRDRVAHHDMGQERGTLRRFLEVCGDRPVDQYSRGDVTTFLDTLRRLPTGYGKSPKDKNRPLAAIIAEADAKDAERLQDKTVKRHLSALSVFLHFSKDRGHLSNVARADLTDDHRFRAQRSAKVQRDAWTSEDLRALFASPVWSGCAGDRQRSKSGPHIIRDSKYWLPLLALFHGARLEELADLYGRDVREVDGIWTLHIVEMLDKAGGGSRRLKTGNAERLIPLHPEMIRLGFLAYVQNTAPGADDPLFPDLEPQGMDRRRGPRITRWFVHYRKQIGLYRPGVAHHAFRHTAITRLTDSITDYQQERHRNYLMGHASGGGEGSVRYDKGPGLKAVAETLALLRFPEVSL